MATDNSSKEDKETLLKNISEILETSSKNTSTTEKLYEKYKSQKLQNCSINSHQE
jgi:hypothetical protein